MKKACVLIALCILVSNFCFSEDLETAIRKEANALNITVNSLAKKADDSGAYSFKGFTKYASNIPNFMKNLYEAASAQSRLISTKTVEDVVYFEIEIAPAKSDTSEISNEDEETKEPDKSPTEALFEAAQNGDAELIKKSVQDGADIRALNSDKQKIMQVADDEVMPLLIELGADSNVTDSSGRPLLVSLIRNFAKPDLISRMLTAGANPDIENKKWGTALENAALICQSEIAEALIKAGAKVNTKDSTGTTALEYTSLGMNPENCTKTAEVLIKGGTNVKEGAGDNALLQASKNKGYAKYLELLIKAGADVNVRSGIGSTPLIHATYAEDIDMVKTLLTAGADTNAKLQDGSTALNIANENKNSEIVKLLESGSKK